MLGAGYGRCAQGQLHAGECRAACVDGQAPCGLHRGRSYVFASVRVCWTGAQVIQEVHIKNRCAWLNHSDNPRAFMDIVARHRNVK